MSDKPKLEYNQKNMVFRRLGFSGLRVPVFSLGGWLTFGATVTGDTVKDIVRTAIENGVCMFDEAENYADGKSELELGRVLKELGVRRADFIVTSKIFWGTRPGPNNMGLSRKHIIEGVKESLQRLQLEYLDVVFAHRPDTTAPILETVRAFDWVINQGLAHYWGTSEWSAREIEEAHQIAERYGYHAPVAEQCRHNLLTRERAEGEYDALYKKYNTGTTVFSALASGMLTGKYNDAVIPKGSRFDTNRDFFKGKDAFLQSEEGQAQIAQVKALSDLAAQELDCTVSQLALAWVLRINPNTSTVILGCTSTDQLLSNLKALEVYPKMTKEILDKIELIVGNKPADLPTYGRPPLDLFGRH
ncbi:Aldo/keto reductase [Peniophora sp. CONT]|nr:Aldo/keto reductase [Peniophora sp. CONT]